MHSQLLLFCILVVTVTLRSPAQTDTLTFQWPVEPFYQTHEITGTFCEYRSTSATGHFHNGVDIPKPDGSPVFSVRDGIVTSLSRTGSDAFVRVRYDDGQTDAYVHINPSPIIGVGSPVVKGVTVLGTILVGAGHVHFTHGAVGDERNALRPEGGFAPFVDTYPPVIRFVQFHPNGSVVQFSDNKVQGLVDIIVKVDEQNGPPWTSVSRLNNGTYAIGYRILSEDRTTVVYEPPENGLRYRFDRKPNNAYVNTAYFQPMSSTTSHVYIVTNGSGASSQFIGDGYWDTRPLPPGKYWVKVFTYDTRFNADTSFTLVEVTETDLTPPAPVAIHSVTETAPNELTVRWYPNADADLKGYRLFFSLNGSSWTRQFDEAHLGPDATERVYRNIAARYPIYFRLTAVDDAAITNESQPSSVYGIRFNNTSSRVLIVDGFNRDPVTRRYPNPTHNFAFTHAQSIPWDYVTSSREAVLDGSIVLDDYAAVVWFLGDTPNVIEAFDSTARAKLSAYLDGGGRLFLNGSGFANLLQEEGGEEGRKFLSRYLMVERGGGRATAGATVRGVAGTHFEDVCVSLGNGLPYPVDSVDVLRPVEPAVAVLEHADKSAAAVAYKGPFVPGGPQGAVVIMAIPFETIATQSEREAVMAAVFRFLDVAMSAEPDIAGDVPEGFSLSQNYPNPFNPSTRLEFYLPQKARVTLKVFDLLGREVAQIVDGEVTAGVHSVTWNATGLAAGVYLARLEAGPFVQIRTMMLVK